MTALKSLSRMLSKVVVAVIFSGVLFADEPVDVNRKQLRVPGKTDIFGDPLPVGAYRLGTMRLRHGGYVGPVVFSPDGSMLASSGGSTDSTVSVWETKTGRELARLPPVGTVSALAFAPNGRMLVVAARGTLHLWDFRAAGLAKKIAIDGFRHLDKVYCLRFSSDGRVIAGSDGSSIRLWDVATGAVSRTIAANARSIAFSQDGNTLAAESSGRFSRWSVKTGDPVAEQRQLDSWGAAVFSPDAKKVAVAVSLVSANLQVIDVETGKPAFKSRLHGGAGIESIAFSRDGKHIATSGSGTVVTALPSGTEVLKIDAAGSVAFSDDGTTLALGTYRGVIRLWDVATKKERISPVHSGGIVSLAHSRRGDIATATADGAIALWPRDTRPKGYQKAEHPLELGTELRFVAFARDGRTLVSVSSNGVIVFWDLSRQKSDLEQTHKLAIDHKSTPYDSNVTALTLNSDGTRLAVTSTLKKAGLVILDLNADGEPKIRATIEEPTKNGAFSPDGTVLATLNGDGILQLRDPSSARVVKAYKSEEGLAASFRGRLAFSPDGKLLAIGTTILNLTDGRMVSLESEASDFRFEHGRYEVESLSWSSDGKWLATGGSWIDPALVIWDVAKRRPWAELRGHRGAVHDLVFLHASALASASGDTTALIWDVKEAGLDWIVRRRKADFLRVFQEAGGSAADFEHVVWPKMLAFEQERLFPDAELRETLLEKRLIPKQPK
jgi:WD40 repeat protein